MLLYVSYLPTNISMEPSCLHKASQAHHVNAAGEHVIFAAIRLIPERSLSLKAVPTAPLTPTLINVTNENPCWTRGADAKYPPHEFLHTIKCNFNSCHLTREQNSAFQTAVTGLQGSIQKPTKRNSYKLFVQQMTIVQYKSTQYCFLL